MFLCLCWSSGISPFFHSTQIYYIGFNIPSVIKYPIKSHDILAECIDIRTYIYIYPVYTTVFPVYPNSYPVHPNISRIWTSWILSHHAAGEPSDRGDLLWDLRFIWKWPGTQIVWFIIPLSLSRWRFRGLFMGGLWDLSFPKLTDPWGSAILGEMVMGRFHRRDMTGVALTWGFRSGDTMGIVHGFLKNLWQWWL